MNIRKKINKINKNLQDIKMKNRLLEHINTMINNKPSIVEYKNTLVITCNINGITHDLKITFNKNKIEYMYEVNKLLETCKYYKLQEEYMTKLSIRNNNKKYEEMSIYNELGKEEITIIQEENKKSIYKRTSKDNIVLKEENQDESKYYIGLNENRYENYLNKSTIFTEIDKEEFEELVLEENENKVLKKYFPINKN